MMKPTHRSRAAGPAFPLLAAALFAAAAALVLGAGCSDRLPTSWQPDAPPVDTVSVNSFIVDGGIWRNALFNLSSTPARAYWFADDTLTSIWKGDFVPRTGGNPVAVTIQLEVPGTAPGVYPWMDAIAQPAARSKTILRLDDVEYASVSGGTQIWYILVSGRLILHANFSGILQARMGTERITLRDGRLIADFF